MKKKNLKDVIRIKEKRTFVLNALCECGGEFALDIGDAGSIFSSLFSSVGGDDKKATYKHKCRKCGKITEFHYVFPCEKSFEIGLDTDKDSIANYVTLAFEKELEDVVGFESNIEG